MAHEVEQIALIEILQKQRWMCDMISPSEESECKRIFIDSHMDIISCMWGGCPLEEL